MFVESAMIELTGALWSAPLFAAGVGWMVVPLGVGMPRVEGFVWLSQLAGAGPKVEVLMRWC